jgi:hypothetical protein
VPRVKYAMDSRPRNSFSMSCASRMVIFPGVSLRRASHFSAEWLISVPTHHQMQIDMDTNMDVGIGDQSGYI